MLIEHNDQEGILSNLCGAVLKTMNTL